MTSRAAQSVFLAAVVFTAGCALLRPAGHPARAQLECRAEVLAPYLGSAAEQAAVQIQGGGIQPVQLLLSLGLTPAEVVDVAERYQACGGAAPEAVVPVDGGQPT